MHKNLVIVESPTKAKTIEKFLGKDYKVMSSYGHIRDLKRKELSINIDSLTPDYEIPEEKQQVVKSLKQNAEKAEKVWLASDEDREGEAISWHLCEVLGLDMKKTNRIVFHEITKPAILEALQNPRHINMNLVNAQQARRVLDRLVGFKLSPVLWRKVKPALSAGRVQSVAVRLIVERERDIREFKSEEFYKVVALFALDSGEEVKAELSSKIKTHDEVTKFLEACMDATFTVDNVSKKPLRRSPAPPFTTSTLQQEAARKLGFTVTQTMVVAQRLYEQGLITYMRTDSVNLSGLCISASKKEISSLYGEKYSQPRNFQTRSKGAQEAHEAIRPTYMSNQTIDGGAADKRLYELIWKRTAASQMADAELEKTVVSINISGMSKQFIATGEVVKFDGFMKVYHESPEDDSTKSDSDGVNILPPIKAGQILNRKEVSATQRFTQPPLRYTEAALVHKLEELGIGRPSTYAPTISTIQQREYVHKGDKKGEERKYTIDTLKGGSITKTIRKETVGSEKGKLLPTDVGIVVNDFLMENFPNIMDYNFTANVEKEFDFIAEGNEKWQEMMTSFYNDFEPVVNKVMNIRAEHKAGERHIGVDPTSGKPVYVKIGRFGPVVQIGSAEDEEKPLFAQLPSDKTMDSITLEEAMELFKLPRTLGELEGKKISVGTGRFGPYVLCDGKYVSIPKGKDPMTINLSEAASLIEEKRKQEREKHIKVFEEDGKLEVLNGRYGPYIAYNGGNYRLPKNKIENIKDITYEECMEIVNSSPAKPKRRGS